MNSLNNIIPTKAKSLFLAKHELSVLVYEAVNLDGINYTLSEVQALFAGLTVTGHTLADKTIPLNQAAAWSFIFQIIRFQWWIVLKAV